MNLDARLAKLETVTKPGRRLVVWDSGQGEEQLEKDIARLRGRRKITEIMIVSWKKPEQ